MKRSLVTAQCLAFLAATLMSCSMFGPSVKVGEDSKDFTLDTIEGKPFSLSSLKGRKAVLLGIGSPYG